MKNNKQNKIPIFINLLLSTLLISSCSLFEENLADRIVPELTALNNDEGEGYKKESATNYTIYDVYNSNNMKIMPSIGESSLLVVPVSTLDGPKWDISMIDNLQKAFFGDSDVTGWESVSSFYKKSSYGKLDIVGQICDPFNLNYTTSELANSSTSGGEKEPYVTVVDEFEKSDIYNHFRKDFDKDNDGYIDAVAFIYSNEIDSKNGYWAVTSWNSSKRNIDNPNVNVFMWASYNFIYGNQTHDNIYSYSAYENKVDAHTLIHETGHLLGLDDYYCYDNSYDPSGIIEMQSNNIGDHSIFSKFVLGWVNPYVVSTQKKTTLTLRTSSKYPDAILINDSWNKSTLDEYIIIEYYSPDILNNKDAVTSYKGNGFRMYTTSGFRIYHVDARIVEVSIRGLMKDYATKIENGKYYFVGASNSPSLSYLNSNKNDFKLLHLLEASGKNTFKNGKCATNETLFKKGDVFEPSKEFFYNNDSFNNGERINYKFFINDSSKYQGTITIERY